MWISSLLTNGKARRIRERFEQGQFQLYFAQELLTECLNVLSRPKFTQQVELMEIARTLKLIQDKCVFVELPPKIPSVCRDPTDDAYLACAKIAQCNFIVTGDADLLSLGTYENIQIIEPAQFLLILESDS